MTSPAPPDIPAVLELVTPAWLTSAMADELGDATVAHVLAAPIGTGQMCDSFRLMLTYDRHEAGPSSVVAKLPATDPSSRAAGLKFGIYESEVRFYQELAPVLAIETPRAFHAAIDAGTADFVLLLEDLAPATQGDQLAGCTVEQAALVVDEMVGLHAPLWDAPALSEMEWLRHSAQGRATIGTVLPGFWEGFVGRYAEQLAPAVIDLGTSFLSSIDSYARLDPGPATVVHGDFRLDNLLFGGMEGTRPVVVVDWQTCARGSAASDLAYFLGSGLVPELRREAEHDLVRHYHDRLLAAGVHDYDWDRFWHAYRVSTLGGLIMVVRASMLVERTERGDAMFMTMAERHAQHALDLRALEVI